MKPGAAFVGALFTLPIAIIALALAMGHQDRAHAQPQGAPLAASATATPVSGLCSTFAPSNRNVTFVNKCGYPVWVRVTTATGLPSNLPSDFQYGHELFASGAAGDSFQTCFTTPLPSLNINPETDCTGSGSTISCGTGGAAAPQPGSRAELTLGTNNATGALPIPIPTAATSFSNLYVGDSFLVPKSITINATLGGTVYTATDSNGNGSLSGDGITGTVDYDTGTVTQITLPQAPTSNSDKISTIFSYYGTDSYDVSIINGYNVPVTIVPNGGGVPAGVQSCSATKNYCPAGFTCDTANGICLHTCTAVDECGGYPWECVTEQVNGSSQGVCVDPTSAPYHLCGSPGCTQSGSSGSYACVISRRQHGISVPVPPLCSGPKAVSWRAATPAHSSADTTCPMALRPIWRTTVGGW